MFQLARKQLASFGVAHGVEQGAGRPEALQQRCRFLHQPVLVHAAGAPVDALTQIRRIEAQFQDPPGRRPLTLLTGEGPAGGVEHLQGPLGTHGIGRHDSCRRRRVRLSQQAVAEGLAERRQLGPQGWLRGDRRGRQARQQRLEIEAAAAHQQGHAAAAVFCGDGGLGQLGEFLKIDRLVGIAQIEEFVPHAAPLGGGGLGGAHIHPPVELAGIHRDHRQIKGLGQLQGQVGLAASGGPHQGDGHGLECP